MCDCYDHKCECCETTLPFHIADFKYPRGAFMVWCHRHIKAAPDGAIIFRFRREDVCNHIPKGTKYAVLGPMLGSAYGNHPNTHVDWDEEQKGYDVSKNRKAKVVEKQHD